MEKTMRKSLFAAPLLFMISVAPAFAAVQHNVPWYIANPQQLQAEVSACQADPGDLANSPDCVNATEAEHEVIISEL